VMMQMTARVSWDEVFASGVPRGHVLPEAGDGRR
jgi:hypothetical protein